MHLLLRCMQHGKLRSGAFGPFRASQATFLELMRVLGGGMAAMDPLNKDAASE
jgi:hypothetical protein